MKMVQEEIRKGPWTEQEDLQLVCFVGLFGDRRWDFIAKVSGLKRTGKSCRLRWINYLHPGLKRGKMTPQEEKLVIQLHSQLGNRWSKIARRLPGRTDNEIKNYWRTYMRKKALEGKRTSSPSSSSSTTTSNLTSTSNRKESRVVLDMSSLQGNMYRKDENSEKEELYSMDDIWKEINSEEEPIKPFNNGYSEGSNFSCPPMASPLWGYCPEDTLWNLDQGQSKMFFSTNDHIAPCDEYHT